MKNLLCAALLLAVVANSKPQNLGWQRYSHGNKHLVSGMTFMESHTTKLFGVDAHGRLWERLWTGAWHWHNHGVPSGMWHGEKLKSAPCALHDGKIFIISSSGRLFERHWSGGNWHWANHGRALGFVPIDSQKCVATRGNHRHRVFVVGVENRVYQRVWKANSVGQYNWRWVAHGYALGEKIIAGGIGAAIADNEKYLYAVGQHGKFYKLQLSNNHHPGLWIYLGTPPGRIVKSVAVEHVVLVTTSVSEVWRFDGPSAGNFVKLGKVTHKAIKISKPFKHTCHGSSVLMAIVQAPNRLYSMVIQNNTGQFSYIGYNSSPFPHLPAVLQNPKCPKVFTVAANGDMVEYFV